MNKEELFNKVQERIQKIKEETELYKIVEEEVIQDFNNKIQPINEQLELLTDCILELADFIYADDEDI